MGRSTKTCGSIHSSVLIRSKEATAIRCLFVSYALDGNFKFLNMGACTETCWLLSILHTWFSDAVRARFKKKLELIAAAVAVETSFPAVSMVCASVTDLI